MDDTFVGMKVLVFKSFVGKNCVIEPGVILMGVKVADGHYVPAGSVVKTQADADALPAITADYPMKDMNKGVLHVNRRWPKGICGRPITDAEGKRDSRLKTAV
jgi:carbonic anhydrase/acetyltransferase-like protein (isoleucine patch superfamily)